MGKVGVDKSIDNYIIESKLFDDIASDLSLKYVIEKWYIYCQGYILDLINVEVWKAESYYFIPYFHV